MLHAAALDNRPPAGMYRWSHAAGSAKEATTILATHPGATPGWDRALDAITSADQRTRDSTWAMVANTFAPLVDAARRLAARSAGQRLDPPLALILDEAANYPLPSLPALMSEGGGSGITTVAVLQSLAQARDRWGREAGEAIWDSAIAKVILGGSTNADDLGDISRLIGERQVTEWFETRTGGTPLNGSDKAIEWGRRVRYQLIGAAGSATSSLAPPTTPST